MEVSINPTPNKITVRDASFKHELSNDDLNNIKKSEDAQAGVSRSKKYLKKFIFGVFLAIILLGVFSY